MQHRNRLSRTNPARHSGHRSEGSLWRPAVSILRRMGFPLKAVLISIAFGKRWIYLAAAALVAIGLVPHSYGIIARMLIMGRPPVTNLYATFIFVAWVCCVLGLAVEYFQRNRLGFYNLFLHGGKCMLRLIKQIYGRHSVIIIAGRLVWLRGLLRGHRLQPRLGAGRGRLAFYWYRAVKSRFNI